MRRITLITKIGLFGLTSLFLLSCASAPEPSVSYIYQIPSIPKTEKVETVKVTGQTEEANKLFLKLYQKDAVLAEELGKIPEFQDGEINEEEVETLEDIFKFYLQHPRFKGATDALLNVGKKEYRKYCSPLQALFWYAEEEEMDNRNGAIYKTLFNSNLSRKAKFGKFLWTIWFKPPFFQKQRWEDYSEVRDRLNSPMLVTLYLAKFFKYDKELIPLKWNENAYTPRQVFKRKGGICHDAANFACAMLKRAGYEVHTLTTKAKSGKWIKGFGTISIHTVGVFKENGKIYKIGDTRCLNKITGPYNSYKEVAESLEDPGNLEWYHIDERSYGW